MSAEFDHKDNEFIAWYPLALDQESATAVWEQRRAGYYVHIPFCTAVCDYCGFAVQPLKGADPARYLEALRLEIDRYARSGRLTRQRFVCGHFGGGTPSAISGEALAAIKRFIDASFDVAPTAEVTVEVNPISFSMEKAAAYLDAGVNRLSVGVQSFNDETLKTIGRPHRVCDIDEALVTIRTLGFANYSIDLMYGAPGQTVDDLRDDLQRAINTGAAHISTFRLEIIPFTVLKMRESAGLLPPRVGMELLDEMDDLVSQTLTAVGYREYGAFNFVRPGFESVHNEIAFVAPQAEYVGFGNSAYSFVNDVIYCNQADVQEYEAASFAGRDPIAFARRANAMDLMSRYFVLGVKFFRVPRQPFIRLFGMQPEEVFGPVLDRLIAASMIRRDDDSYLLTPTGRKYVNNVSKCFFTGDSCGQRQHAQFVPTITPDQILHYSRLARERQALRSGEGRP